MAIEKARHANGKVHLLRFKNGNEDRDSLTYLMYSNWLELHWYCILAIVEGENITKLLKS